MVLPTTETVKIMQHPFPLKYDGHKQGAWSCDGKVIYGSCEDGFNEFYMTKGPEVVCYSHRNTNFDICGLCMKISIYIEFLI
jgi:hypothetical protein